MKRNTFLFIAALSLTGCYFAEKNAPTYETAKAEAESVQTMYQESAEPYNDGADHYEAHIILDSIILTDPNTGAEIYSESIDSGSKLANAILKDNE